MMLTNSETKLVQARNEYYVLLNQFNQATDIHTIDEISYKLTAKERELDALKDLVMLEKNAVNFAHHTFRSFELPA